MRQRLSFIVAALVLSNLVLYGQGLSAVHSFNYYDGQTPLAGLVLSGNTLYGSTEQGATNSGEIFQVNTDGTAFNILRNFTNTPDGANPQSDLLLLGDTLYGTTLNGGANGLGTVFSINTNGGNYTILCSFTNVLDGNPNGSFVFIGGNLYGVAGKTIYSLNTNGSGYQTIYTFTNTGNVNPEGLSLWNNTLYGVTGLGGSNRVGFAYSIDTNGNNFNILHNFSSFETLSGPPSGHLVLHGNLLYGTTGQGGSGLYGTVFAMATNGTSYSIIHNFTNVDGQMPRAGVYLSGNKLYGTTSGGGASGTGTIFSLNTDGTAFTTLASFPPFRVGTQSNPTGAAPHAGVLLSGTVLFGTATVGGTLGNGTVFSVPIPSIISGITANPDGSMTINFSGAPTNTFLLEATTNLTPPVIWQCISTNEADTNGLWQFTDSGASNHPYQFYRSATAP